MPVEEPEILQAQADYIDYPDANTPVRVNARSLAHKGHAVVKRTPSMWAPITVDYVVEAKVAPPSAPSKPSGKSGG